MKFENLEKSGLINSLSDVARDIFLPDGIFYWSGRASKEADINATIGSAKGKASHFLPGGDDKVKTFYLPSVIEALRKVDAEQVASYAAIPGIPGFRDAWKKWVVRKLSPHYTFDEKLVGTPIVVPGATAGLYYLSRMFLSPGSSVICHDRHWENYDLLFTGCQGVNVDTIPLFDGECLNCEALASEVAKRSTAGKPVVVVLNFPNNPTGYMPSKEEGVKLKEAIIEAAGSAKSKIVLIFDDAYEGYVYEDDAAPISLFGHFIGAHPNIIPIKCDGATKEFLLYGGRTAAVTFGLHPEWGEPAKVEAELENKMKSLIRGSISNCNHAMQKAVEVALQNPETIDKERKTIIDILGDRYKVLKTELNKANLGDSIPDPYNSGFFCSLNVKIPAAELADKLLKEYKVGIIPTTNEELGINSIRIAFCSVEVEEIPVLVERISACIATF